MLAQPTRRRLFALLSRLGGAATTDELAERLGLHPNGVQRPPRSSMRDAGLVSRTPCVAGPRAPARRVGDRRPAPRPAASGREAYRPLAQWLARAIPATPGPAARGRGRRPSRSAGRSTTPAVGPPEPGRSPTVLAAARLPAAGRRSSADGALELPADELPLPRTLAHPHQPPRQSCRQPQPAASATGAARARLTSPQPRPATRGLPLALHPGRPGSSQLTAVDPPQPTAARHR